MNKIVLNIIKAIQTILGFGGFLTILGAVGSSDANLITVEQCANQASKGAVMIIIAILLCLTYPQEYFVHKAKDADDDYEGEK